MHAYHFNGHFPVKPQLAGSPWFSVSVSPDPHPEHLTGQSKNHRTGTLSETDRILEHWSSCLDVDRYHKQLRMYVASRDA